MTPEAICAGWQGSPRGYALKDAATILGGRYRELDPDDPGNYDWIHLQLQRSRWLVVEAFAKVLSEVIQGPVSRFGAMWTGELSRLHAVVLIGADERFHYLDPYYPASGQPFSMSRKDLERAFNGYLIEILCAEPRA